jgi:hypothetical protein
MTLKPSFITARPHFLSDARDSTVADHLGPLPVVLIRHVGPPFAVGTAEKLGSYPYITRAYHQSTPSDPYGQNCLRIPVVHVGVKDVRCADLVLVE